MWAALLATICAFVATADGIDAATWNLVLNDTGKSPQPVRGEFTLNVYNGSQLVLYGGCNIEFDVFYSDLWTFDASQPSSTDVKWRQLHTSGQKPAGSCGHGAVVVGDTLYVYGGLVAAGSGVSDELHAINLHDSLTWRRIGGQAKGFAGIWPPPRSLIQHSMRINAKGDGFILASGTSSADGDDDSAFAFSVRDGSWGKISNGQAALSGNIGGSAIGITDSGLFVLGGFRKGVIDALLFLPESEWSPNATFEQLSSNLGGLAFEGMVVVERRYLAVYGGFKDDAINPYVYVYDTTLHNSAGSWCKIGLPASSQPLPHFASGWSSIGDGSIFAFGGRINPSGSREELATDLWRLDGIKNAIAADCDFE